MSLIDKCDLPDFTITEIAGDHTEGLRWRAVKLSTRCDIPVGRPVPAAAIISVVVPVEVSDGMTLAELEAKAKEEAKLLLTKALAAGQ